MSGIGAFSQQNSVDNLIFNIEAGVTLDKTDEGKKFSSINPEDIKIKSSQKNQQNTPAPSLKSPSVAGNSKQLIQKIQDIEENIEATSPQQQQEALEKSKESQQKQLEKRLNSLEKNDIAALSETSNFLGTTFNINSNINSTTANSAEQNVKSDSSGNDATVQRDVREGMIPEGNKNYTFDVRVMASSATQGVIDNYQELIELEKKNKATNTELKSKTAEVAFKQAEHSATATVDAGIAGKNQALTGAITNVAFAGAGGLVQYKGASKSINAQTVHSSQANKLTQQANTYEAQAASALSSNTLTGQSDAKILKQTALLKQNEAAKQSLESTRVTMLGNRQQANGNLITSIAGSMGQLTSAQYQVSQAEHQSESQLRMTDQQISNARAEADERQAQNNDQLIRQCFQDIKQFSSNKNANSSSLIRV